MLDLIEKEKPAGGNQWDRVAAEFNVWAKAENRPTRLTDSIRKKFQAVGVIFNITCKV